jgi:hypothetical protein
MIRFLIGLLILAGSAGNDDYAMAVGATPPSLLQTATLGVIGLFLMFWGVDSLKKDEKNW